MNKSEFFKVRNFCQGRPLLSLARGIKKPSYGTGLHITIKQNRVVERGHLHRRVIKITRQTFSEICADGF
jgi:hypothetical protein